MAALKLPKIAQYWLLGGREKGGEGKRGKGGEGAPASSDQEGGNLDQRGANIMRLSHHHHYVFFYIIFY